MVLICEWTVPIVVGVVDHVVRIERIGTCTIVDIVRLVVVAVVVGVQLIRVGLGDWRI